MWYDEGLSEEEFFGLQLDAEYEAYLSRLDDEPIEEEPIEEEVIEEATKETKKEVKEEK